MEQKHRQSLFFSSNYIGIFRNTTYLCRRHLYKNIKANAEFLNGKLLDFGCGTKPYQYLFSKVTEYIGLDYENEGHGHENEVIDRYYDGKEIPFDADYFDSLLSTEVLEHVEDLNFTLKEWNRVLKPNGKLLITLPFCFIEHELPNDFRRFTSVGIEKLLSDNGFECLKIIKMGSPIEAINQLKISYLEEILPLKYLFIRIPVKLFIFAPIIVWALFWSWVLPKKQPLYINTLILAEKADKVKPLNK